jgi:hypothetical protein
MQKICLVHHQLAIPSIFHHVTQAHLTTSEMDLHNFHPTSCSRYSMQKLLMRLVFLKFKVVLRKERVRFIFLITGSALALALLYEP